MPLLYDELFTCPNCETIFQSKVLGCYNTFGVRYSDLYIASEDSPQPILFQNNICPKCGFSAFSIEFRIFDIDMEIVRKAITKVENFTGKNAIDFNAGDGFLEIAEYMGRVSLETRISITLQAVYAYRELADINLEKTQRYLLNLIEQNLAQKTFNENPEELYLYLAGEFNRLLKKDSESLKYFKEAITKAPKNSFISRITQYQLSTPNEIIPKEVFGR
ncbi:MAG: DUF2225 domain-containing protein [Candidatus Heimdallarchaeota archaeon]|nr:DUF2225 domain-containing protein [Candidatus Heimdallarchaeota archaeon]